MNPWRIAISAFILVLLTIVTLGFIWTGSHQAPELRVASHIVLGVSGFAGLFALVRLWRPER